MNLRSTLGLVILSVILAACATAAPPAPTAPTATDTEEAAAFTETIAARLRAAAPAWSVRVQAPLTLATIPGPGEDHLAVNLDRIFRVCRADPPNCPRLSDEYVARTIASAKEIATPLRAAALRTVLRPEAYVDELRRTMPADRAPVTAPFLPGMMRVVVADTPNAMRPLGATELAALGFTAAQALAAGQRNVAGELGPLPAPPPGLSPSDVLIKTGNSYESSRLLDPAAWSALAAARGGMLLVAAPSADLVLIGRGDTQAGRTLFAAALAEHVAKAQRPLSDTAWRWTGTGWEAVDLRPRT